MPEQKPSSRIISMSYSVRWRRRWASTSLPAASNVAQLLLELVADLPQRPVDASRAA